MFECIGVISPVFSEYFITSNTFKIQGFVFLFFVGGPNQHSSTTWILGKRFALSVAVGLVLCSRREAILIWQSSLLALLAKYHSAVC